MVSLGLGLGHRWKRFAALAALMIVEIEAQQISRSMNESAMGTCPRRHGQRMIAFPTHFSRSLSRRLA
jgi:hypothetical protein